MPYKDRTLQLLAKRLYKLRDAIREGRAYTPRIPEHREAVQRRKLMWRVVQALYQRLNALGWTPYKRWHAKHGEERNRRRRAHYAQERGGVVRSRLHGASPAEARRMYKKNRAARKRGQGGSLSPGIRVRLWDQQRGRCAACQQGLVREGAQQYHLDHIEPLARGGAHTDANVQLLCPSCNVRKGARPPMEFMQEVIGKLF